MYIVSRQPCFRKIKKGYAEPYVSKDTKERTGFFGAPEVWGGGAKSTEGD